MVKLFFVSGGNNRVHSLVHVVGSAVKLDRLGGSLASTVKCYSITELLLLCCVTFANMVRSDTNPTRTSLFVCRPTRLNTSHVMKGQYFIPLSFRLYNPYFFIQIFHPFIFSSVQPLFFHPKISSLQPVHAIFSREKFHPAKVNSDIFFIRAILFIRA